MKSSRTTSLSKRESFEEHAVAKRLQSNSLLTTIRHYIVNHFQACIFGFGELIRAPLASVMTILVIAIAIAFPAGLYVLLRNFTGITQQWHGTPTVSLYLQHQVTSDRLASLLQLLRQRVEIQSVDYISPAQGLQQFIAQTKLGDALKALPENPLPGVIVVTPKPQYQTHDALHNLLLDIKSLGGVEAGRLDMIWVQRLHNFALLGERITYGLGFLLSFGVILIVGNTIRSATQNRRQEIAVMQLIGATNHYIRRPFLYRGFFYGICGGLMAWLIVIVFLKYLEPPAQQLMPHYAQSLWTLECNLSLAVVIILVSTLLSLFGTWLVINHYLRQDIVEV